MTWEDDVQAWKAAQLSYTYRGATRQRKRFPLGCLIVGAFLGVILLVIVVPKGNPRDARVEQYLRIAAEFNMIADNPSDYDLEAEHKHIGRVWASCSPYSLESLVQGVANDDPPKDRWEEADRYVAMGQLTIALMRAGEATPKLRNDLRDSARKLANTVQ